MDPNDRSIINRFYAVLVIIFLAEAAAMLIVHALLGKSIDHKYVLLDSFVLVALSVPVLKIFIVDRYRKEAKLRALEAQLHWILKEILGISFSTVSRDELFRKVLERIVLSKFITLKPLGALFLIDKGELRLTAHIGFSPEHLAACGRVPLGRCLCGKTAQTGKPIYSGKVDGEHDTHPAGITDHGHYCVPIRSGNTVIGVLTLYLPAGHEYDQAEVAFLESVCAVLSQIVAFKRLEETALQLQKMESMGRFAGSIAHDFNNILTPLKGFNSLALDSAPAAGQARQYIEETQKGLDRAAQLVNRLLALSRKPDARMADTDMNETVAAMRSVIEMMMQNQHAVKLELGSGRLILKANKNQLEQIFLNLAVNARDAMQEHGTFLIRTELADRIDEGDCPTDAPVARRFVKVLVSDTGAGMSKETLDHVFEPYYTTKAEGKGTGLGLSTIYSIVKQHNGCIMVDSKPGEGTCFTLWFAAEE